MIAPHVKEMIRIQLEEELGKQILYTGGLRIQTTLNRRMQELAQQSFITQMGQLKKTIVPQIDGALLSIESKTGSVKSSYWWISILIPPNLTGHGRQSGRSVQYLNRSFMLLLCNPACIFMMCMLISRLP